jgi:hypothetical protein
MRIQPVEEDLPAEFDRLRAEARADGHYFMDRLGSRTIGPRVMCGSRGAAKSYWPHTITVAVADAPRPDEILVVMAIADGGRLRNRCVTEPIR